MVLKKQSIPDSVKHEVNKIIDNYNYTVYRKYKSIKFFAEFRVNNLYLKRKEAGGLISPIARLTCTGRMDKWKFAIFRWTLEAYDPDEWFFPGCEFVDGTILGALKAGDEAYPPEF